MKTVELRIDATAPGLTSAQLLEKVDREVRCVWQAFFFFFLDAFKQRLREGILDYSTIDKTKVNSKTKIACEKSMFCFS